MLFASESKESNKDNTKQLFAVRPGENRNLLYENVKKIIIF